MKTHEEARHLLAKILKLKENDITPASNLQEKFGIDSLDFWEMLSGFERKFKIKISQKELSDVETVQEIYNLLDKKLRNEPIGRGKVPS